MRFYMIAAIRRKPEIARCQVVVQFLHVSLEFYDSCSYHIFIKAVFWCVCLQSQQRKGDCCEGRHTVSEPATSHRAICSAVAAHRDEQAPACSKPRASASTARHGPKPPPPPLPLQAASKTPWPSSSRPETPRNQQDESRTRGGVAGRGPGCRWPLQPGSSGSAAACIQELKEPNSAAFLKAPAPVLWLPVQPLQVPLRQRPVHGTHMAPMASFEPKPTPLNFNAQHSPNPMKVSLNLQSLQYKDTSIQA